MSMNGVGATSEAAYIQKIMKDYGVSEAQAKEIIETAGLEFGNSVDGDKVEISTTVSEAQGATSPDFSSLADIEAKYNELKDKIADCARIIKQNTDMRDDEESKKKSLEGQITPQSQINTWQTDKDAADAKYQNAVSEKNKMAADYETSYNNAVAAAKGEYNRQQDGYWDQYLKKYLNKNGITKPDFTELVSEMNTAKNDSSRLGSQISNANSRNVDLNIQISECNTRIKQYNECITTTTAQKIVNEAELAQYEPVMQCINQLSPAEKELIKSLGDQIDLNATNEDGSPKYIFAKGEDDGQMHLYIQDSANDSCCDSVARKFASNSYDIISSGNGYLYNKTAVTEETQNSANAREIFWITETGVDSNKFTYTTDSPLSFDINGDGVKTSNIFTNFDIDGDGTLDTINDSADFVLAFDSDGDGNIGENGLEVFGNNTDIDGDGKKDGYKDGFEALRALAKKEGLIGEGDMSLDSNDLKLLQEKYGLSLKAGYNGEAQTFEDLGITEIRLSNADTELNKNFDGKGNDLMTQEGATFIVNGEEREYADIWNKYKKRNS